MEDRLLLAFSGSSVEGLDAAEESVAVIVEVADVAEGIKKLCDCGSLYIVSSEHKP